MEGDVFGITFVSTRKVTLVCHATDLSACVFGRFQACRHAHWPVHSSGFVCTATWKDGFFHFSAETGVNPNTFNAGIKGGDTLTVANRDHDEVYAQHLALSLVYGTRTTRSASAWAAALETTLAPPSTR